MDEGGGCEGGSESSGGEGGGGEGSGGNGEDRERGMALRHSRTPPGRWSLPVMWEATIAPSSSVRGGLL